MHDLAHARAALEAAAALGVPVTLLSPPGAAASQGVGYFEALVEAARRDFPSVDVTAVLDCGAAPGLALAALRHGIAALRVTAPPRVLARIADIAQQSGGGLLRGRVAALDLAEAGEPLAACRAWLAKVNRGPR